MRSPVESVTAISVAGSLDCGDRDRGLQRDAVFRKTLGKERHQLRIVARQ